MKQHLGGKITMLMRHGEQPGRCNVPPEWAAPSCTPDEPRRDGAPGSRHPADRFQPIRSAYLSLTLGSRLRRPTACSLCSPTAARSSCRWRRRFSLPALRCSGTFGTSWMLLHPRASWSPERQPAASQPPSFEPRSLAYFVITTRPSTCVQSEKMLPTTSPAGSRDVAADERRAPRETGEREHDRERMNLEEPADVRVHGARGLTALGRSRFEEILCRHDEDQDPRASPQSRCRRKSRGATVGRRARRARRAAPGDPRPAGSASAREGTTRSGSCTTPASHGKLP